MGRPKTNRTMSPGGNTRLYFPAGGFPHGIQLIFKKYDYAGLTLGTGGSSNKSNFTSAAQETSLLAIELPMPSSLTDATGLQVTGFERTFLESFIADTLAPAFEGSITEIGKELFDFGKGFAEKGIEALSGMANSGAQKEAVGQASRIASFMMSNTLNSFSPGLGKAMGASRGTAVNPQATLSFEGVNLRQFSFDWTLYPESAEEAQAIKKIIRSMKRVILPTVQGLAADDQSADGSGGTLSGNSLARAFLTYPATVNINLLGIDESHFLRFKPCMVDSINIDYGASGEIVIAEGGVPQGIKLSMVFKELEIQTAEDYEGDDN